MYAVVRTGSKQYRVEPGFEFLVEKLTGAESGKKIELTDVLLVSGDKLSVGTPTVGATIQCTCLGNEKGPKLRSVKYRRRKNFRRTYGHRQEYTRLVVDLIQ